ncbi:hexokinase type 2-like [Diabrotica undecimpunctata]|uniref:hexokinase type 2-like n=1 Tax=Diabrotica undecimpunctata TaxID=50387 RepID=UPI003B636748
MSTSSKCKSKVCNPLHLRGIEHIPARPEIKTKCQGLIITEDKMKIYMKIFLENVERGLKKSTHFNSTVKCFPTYIQDFPDGSESGKYLSLVLDGCTLRIFLLNIDNRQYTVDQKIYSVSQDIKAGPGEQLFDFIAECLAEYTKEKGVNIDNLPLGFIFNFPLQQKGLKIGILKLWTNGYSCEGVIGRDVVQLLNNAVDKREDLKINVVAVANNTTGIFMVCAFKDFDTKIEIMIGVDTNSCYVEKQVNAELFDEPDRGSGNVIVYMEYGDFGDDGALEFCRTQFDRDLDAGSTNVGSQLHKKMISGIYLGELVRLATVKFAKEGILFGGQLSDGFKAHDKFETRFICEIEADPPGVFTNVKSILNNLGVRNATEQDFNDIKYLSQCFSRRAAILNSCMITVLIRKIGYPNITIGVDGALYKTHPHIHSTLMSQVEVLLSPDPYKFKIMLSEEGSSGIGAAIIAAVVDKNRRKITLTHIPEFAAESPSISAHETELLFEHILEEPPVSFVLPISETEVQLADISEISTEPSTSASIPASEVSSLPVLKVPAQPSSVSALNADTSLIDILDMNIAGPSKELFVEETQPIGSKSNVQFVGVPEVSIVEPSQQITEDNRDKEEDHVDSTSQRRRRKKKTKAIASLEKMWQLYH